jgi:DNA-binding transcriptional LysR family regulator
MTLRHLKIFITVADCGSMTNAAQQLFIAQPTVSQAIAELEAYYGVKLFDRLAKRLYITETGNHLLSYARHITALFAEMEQAMKSDDSGGILKIGASLTIGSSILPRLVCEFNNEYPTLKIQAVVKNTTVIESLISKNAIDFGVVEGVIHTSNIVSTPFMADELALVCGKDHPFFETKSIAPCELSKLNFIVREQGSGTRELFANIMAANDLEWEYTWECNSSDCLKSAAISGVGVAVISKRLVENEVKAGTLHQIIVDGLDYQRKFSIVYHKNKFITETMKAFFELCFSFAMGYGK